jgi:hypothetical protein
MRAAVCGLITSRESPEQDATSRYRLDLLLRR